MTILSLHVSAVGSSGDGEDGRAAAPDYGNFENFVTLTSPLSRAESPTASGHIRTAPSWIAAA